MVVGEGQTQDRDRARAGQPCAVGTCHKASPKQDYDLGLSSRCLNLGLLLAGRFGVSGMGAPGRGLLRLNHKTQTRFDRVPAA